MFGGYALWKERGTGRSIIERYMMIPDDYYRDVDEDQWILRLMDDCPGFDPVLYARNITPEQKESYYGIRMIYSLADEVRYLNTLNLNNLIIRFR